MSADVPADLDAATIQARIAVVSARTDIQAQERDLVLKQLRAASIRVEVAKAAREAARDYAAALQSAPKIIATLNAESVPAPSEPESESTDDDPVRMQLKLASLQTEDVSLRSKLRDLEESLSNMASRPEEARAELTDLRRQLDQQQAAILAKASPLLVEADNLLNDATRQELSARIDKAEQELLSLPTRESIATAQHDLAARRIKQVDAAIAVLNTRITAQRKRETEMQVTQAQEFARRLAGQPAALRDYADQNAEIRISLKRLAERLEQARDVQQKLQAQQSEVADAWKNAEQILAIGRISDESGHLLRGLQAYLLAPGALQSRIATREDVIVDARVQRLQIRQELRALQPTDTVAKRYLTANAVADTMPNLDLIATMVERRHAALVDLDEAQGRLISMLSEANAVDSESMQDTEQLRSLLSERLLWLPSASPLGGTWLRQLGSGIAWLIAPSNWSAVLPTLVSTLQIHWLSGLILLAAIIALFLARRRLVTSLETLARPIGHRNDSFRFTLLASAATLLLALTWPLAIGAAGWMLRAPANLGGFTNAVGQGLLAVAIVLFMLGVFIDMCRTHGIFIAHFGWGTQGTRRLARALRLLLLAIAPAALLTAMTDTSVDPELVDGIGRLGFMTGSLALALFLYRVFRPHGGALTGGLDRKGWAMRTRGVWSNALVAIPLLLAGLAAAGYYVSARELQSRLFTSGWIMLAVVIVFSIAMRGVLVASHRAAWRQADERRAKALAGAAEKTDSGEGSDALNLQNQESEIDAVADSQQTRALLRAISGVVLAVLLWGIWSGLVPALNVFNDIALWSHVVSTGAGDKMAVVTLGNVLVSLLTLMLTFIAARNLPGFLEITLLQRLQIDSGTRYAIDTIGRYLILGIGLVAAFNYIGTDWSQLKWIVAALGVGLGFGLQEIVANFISGLIILFERPVRVGDLVSIGPTTGTVSRIKIRAITITDFDNFEVIVPNKAFITEAVQNWSLSSQVTRLLIKLGVAYGSDVKQTQKIMLDVATANPRVLSSPAPSAYFL
ncbi:MAG: mechanosensitive ion channel domain-containing protein, partial [Methylophilaceae bacterium]